MAANFTPTVGVGRPTAAAQQAEDSFFSLSEAQGRAAWVTVVALLAGLTAAYWRVLVDTSDAWTQPQYSHGWIVPLIGLYLLWCRRPDQKERSDLTPLLGAASGIGVAMSGAGFFAGLAWLQGVGLAVVVLSVTAIGLLNQPYSGLSSRLSVDFADSGERVLLGGAAIASLLVAASYAGVIPQKFNVFIMLAAVILYGATLLGVSLAARPGPLRRTGSETIAATVALIGVSLVWIQASQFDMMPLMQLCLISSLLGVVGLVGGRRLLQWAGPAVVFVVFMFPLPSLVEHSLLRVLQKLAAIASTTVLQVMGLPIYRIGSQMVIEGLATPLQLEVAEACSGLRMSTIFIAMTIAMVFLIQRPWWDKFTILLSAIPVALLVNVMRIV
ncbi:MAG: archaeosortase/exosortase family protein, partial [Planctomycetota bacterium]